MANVLNNSEDQRFIDLKRANMFREAMEAGECLSMGSFTHSNPEENLHAFRLVLKAIKEATSISYECGGEIGGLTPCQVRDYVQDYLNPPILEPYLMQYIKAALSRAIELGYAKVVCGKYVFASCASATFPPPFDEELCPPMPLIRQKPCVDPHKKQLPKYTNVGVAAAVMREMRALWSQMFRMENDLSCFIYLQHYWELEEMAAKEKKKKEEELEPNWSPIEVKKLKPPKLQLKKITDKKAG